MTKYGIILPSYINSQERTAMASQSYKSLAGTRIFESDSPMPLFVVAAGEPAFDLAIEMLPSLPQFTTSVLPQPKEITGPDAAVAWLCQVFFDTTDCSHVIELADDMVYNTNWFSELKGLVSRHPDARAWSTYRSAHTRHHRTLFIFHHENGVDHRVTSFAGNGTCWTRDEWREWGVKWEQGPHWPVPTGGDTLDLHHAYYRPGERWVTEKSYMEHLGVRVGVHAGGVEFALHFAGEG